MPTVQELHNVERGTDHAAVFAETECFWHRHICISQRPDDLVFSVYSVGGLREQLAGRLLAQDELTSIGGGDLVCWVGLTEAELLQSQKSAPGNPLLAISLGNLTCFKSSGVLTTGTFWLR